MRPADAVALVRALAVIPIVWCIAAERRDLALALFMVAAASDALDGWLARRAGPSGARGAFLDPLADKILVIGTLLALTFAPNAGWPVAVATVALLARELIVIVVRVGALRQDTVLSADLAGKVKTALEFIGVALIILGGRPWAVLGVVVLIPAFLIGVFTLGRFFSRRLA